MSKRELTEAQERANARGNLAWLCLLTVSVSAGYALGNSPQVSALFAVVAFIGWIIHDQFRVSRKRRAARAGSGFDPDLDPTDEHAARLARQMRAARAKARG